jgi:hypothetical protein
MRTRLATAVACVALVGVLGACGGIGGAGSRDALPDDVEDRVRDLQTAGDANADEGGVTSAEVLPPELFLDGAVTPPPGWLPVPARCDNPDGSVGSLYFAYSVPGDWIARGGGYGGGGGITGTTSQRFETPEGGSVEITIEDELYLAGEVVDANGDPWTTWDFDITQYGNDGEQSHRATFSPLDPVDIDGTSVAVWYLDQTQSDLVSQSEVRARVVFADVPSGPLGTAESLYGQGGRHPYSAAVTVRWDSTQASPLADLPVVLSTFRTTPCVQQSFFEYFDLVLGTDWAS